MDITPWLQCHFTLCGADLIWDGRKKHSCEDECNYHMNKGLQMVAKFLKEANCLPTLFKRTKFGLDQGSAQLTPTQQRPQHLLHTYDVISQCLPRCRPHRVYLSRTSPGGFWFMATSRTEAMNANFIKTERGSGRPSPALMWHQGSEGAKWPGVVTPLRWTHPHLLRLQVLYFISCTLQALYSLLNLLRPTASPPIKLQRSLNHCVSQRI